MRGFILQCEKGLLTDIVALSEKNDIRLDRIEQTTSEDDIINITLYIDNKCNVLNVDNFVKDINNIKKVNSINII